MYASPNLLVLCRCSKSRASRRQFNSWNKITLTGAVSTQLYLKDFNGFYVSVVIIIIIIHKNVY